MSPCHGATALTGDGSGDSSGAPHSRKTQRAAARTMQVRAVMNTNRTTYLLSLATLGLLLLACDSSSKGPALAGTPEMQPSGTGAQTHADSAVVDRLAAARCDREASCRNVGPGAKYGSPSVCANAVRGSIGNDLNAYDCPRGLDGDAIDACMSAIRSEECDHPLDTLTRLEKCRTGALCMK